MTETIYALATVPGKSGVAVVRVSGPDALSSLKNLSGKSSPTPRMADLCRLTDPHSKTDIDRALVIFFEGPASFTGEDVAEYHLHGGMAVVQSLLSALSHQHNHRIAEPGEFTRRAFENGKMDLTEAEAVADLINAETQAQKLQALSQMSGALAKLYDRWRMEIIRTLAYLEADLDFPDEDLPESAMQEIRPHIEKLRAEIGGHLNDNRRGERLRHGIRVAIIGAPNVGKSSLVNMLAQRDVAIVSEHAGTTRDVIDVHLDLAGYPVILSDTAGLRPDQLGQSGQDQIESEGIRRALQKAKHADLRVLVFDAFCWPDVDEYTKALINERALLVLNKIDAAGALPEELEGHKLISISVKENRGIDILLSGLVEKITTLIGQSEAPSLTRQRHRESLESCRGSLDRALDSDLPELMAEDLRLAMRSLGRITGRVDVEDLLDVIFRDFCIGK